MINENELLDVLDELEIDDEELEEGVQALSNPRMATEQLIADLQQTLSEQEFTSKEEFEQFLDKFNFDELGNSKPSSIKERARDLLFEAWEREGAERVRLAKKALELHPNSADAYVILAQEVATNLEEMRDYYYMGMAAGETDLGTSYFIENRGHFWGLLETRPYMRAKQGYAECMWELGIGTVANTHFYAALTGSSLASELVGPQFVKKDIIKEDIQYENGHLILPSGSGWGVELDEDAIREFMG